MIKRILNVAEKPSAAKEITKFLSRGSARTVYSPIPCLLSRSTLNQDTIQFMNSNTFLEGKRS